MNSPLFHLDHLIIIVVFLLSLQLQLSIESDSIILGSGDKLTGNGTLISKGRVFEMGFFSLPSNSSSGIWYKYKGVIPVPEKTVVWVPNGDSPVSNPRSSWFELNEYGGHLVYGHLILRSAGRCLGIISGPKILGCHLPGSKFGYDNDTGFTTTLTSCADSGNSTTGSFNIRVSRINPNVSEVQISVRSWPYDCCYARDYDIYLGEINKCDSIIASSYGYIKIKYSSNHCLLRYVLDVTGEFHPYVWWDYNQQWQLATKQHKIGKKNATMIAIAASAILAPLLVAIIVLVINRQRKHSGTSLEAPGGDTLKQYKHKDLQRATKNLSQKLGKGGFRTVYIG
ncbi:hypothetical protein RIF29_24140 [Crotalaria pallida]|uniref:Uncharacterized protein n=1 Tax=Crotalaria pallida TaxID=3830 RepID=A0AAN9ELE9_CROPI